MVYGSNGALAVFGGHCGRYEKVLDLYDYEMREIIINATGMKCHEQYLEMKRQ
jgi:hypothetical protein